MLVGRLVDLLDERDDELELLELRVGLALRLDEELGDALRVGVELRVVEELDFRVEELLELPRLAELLVLLDPRRVAELPLLLLPRALYDRELLEERLPPRVADEERLVERLAELRLRSPPDSNSDSGASTRSAVAASAAGESRITSIDNENNTESTSPPPSTIRPSDETRSCFIHLDPHFLQ